MDRLKNRRGVTLVLMAFMLTMLIGAAAFAVDFGRMYFYRAQLHTASDAAALAGAWQILKKDPNSASDSAVAIANRHFVGTQSISLASADVIPGTWTSGGGFVVSTWTDPNLSAVQVTTRLTGAPYGFGRILGLTTHDVSATSQAVMGYVGKTTCVRPVALPYQALLDQLTKHDGVARDAATYPLTDADVTALRNAGVDDSVQLRVTDEGASPVNGNFYGIKLGPYQFADGTLGSPDPGMNSFDTDLGGPCSGESYKGTVGPGDWLEPENGEGGTNIPRGISELCGGIQINGNKTVPCPLPYPEIKAAVWAPNASPPAGCSNCFYVRYLGVFAVVGYTSTPGHGTDGIWGYFTAMPSTGSLTSTPGPIQKIGLVK